MLLMAEPPFHKFNGSYFPFINIICIESSNRSIVEKYGLYLIESDRKDVVRIKRISIIGPHCTKMELLRESQKRKK